MSTASQIPHVILVRGEAALGEIEAARSYSIWRALCQCVQLEVVAGPSENRASTAAQKAVATDAKAIVLLDGATVEAAALPQGCRVIGVPTLAGEVSDAARELWLRNETERAAWDSDPREQRIVRDAFEPADARITPSPDVAAFLTDSDSVEVYLTAAAAVPGKRLLIPADLIGKIAPNVAQPVEAFTTLPEALLRAGTCVIPAASNGHAAHPLLGWAMTTQRKLIFADGSEGPDPGEIPGMDPGAALTDVAAALGVDMPDDPARTGALVARNLGLTVSVAHATYHPILRLFHAFYDLGGTVPNNCLAGSIQHLHGADETLVNAWVRDMDAPPDIAGRLRATAALRPGAAISEVEVAFFAWDWPIQVIPAATGLITETGGLVGLDIDETKAEVTYWASQRETVVQLGRKPMKSEPLMKSPSGPYVNRVSADFPFNRDTLTVLPPYGHGQKFTKFAQIATPMRTTSDKLAAMKDAYAGRTGWLIGNGPSVRTEDLDKLSDTGALCFCFNRFHLAYESTRLRPDFTVTGDLQMIEDFGQMIVDEAGGTVFTVNETAPDILGDYIWVRLVPVFPSLFSSNAPRGVTPGGSSVYMALQIGYYLGIRNWYIYGADFGFRFSRPRHGGGAFRSAEGDGNHFIPNYRSGKPWCPPAIENILTAFYAARLKMEAEGGRILNATRGGYLEVFDRIDFEDALSQEVASAPGTNAAAAK